MNALFSPITLGSLTLNNRVVMAPMTRARANNADNAADQNTAIYYAQRASAGLIISEGTPISQQGQGFLFLPGIYTAAQVAGWRATTTAVHQQGGVIFAQIWHVGRMSHTSLQPDGQAPVSSVATQGDFTCFTYDETGRPGKVPVSKPKALTIEEIAAVKHDYVQAAQNAIAAGFDGVEIHGANGYLLEQFINAGLNTRDDQYGGQTIENRLRFTLEVVDAVIDAIGAERTGIRISPFGRFSDMPAFAGEHETWLTLANELSQRKLAYVHLSDQEIPGSDEMTLPDGFVKEFRAAYQGVLMIAGLFDQVRAEHYLEQGLVDMVAFGRPYISNPDLVERMQNGWPLAPAKREYFYGGDNTGYIDYPRYQEQR